MANARVSQSFASLCDKVNKAFLAIEGILAIIISCISDPPYAYMQSD